MIQQNTTDWTAYKQRELTAPGKVLEAGKCKSKAAAQPFPGAWLGPSCCVLACREGPGRSVDHSLRPLPYDLVTSQRPHLCIPSPLGVNISACEFWRRTGHKHLGRMDIFHKYSWSIFTIFWREMPGYVSEMKMD